MKILLSMNLPYYPALGGANKANRFVMEGLARKGHAVRAVVPALGVPSKLSLCEFREEVVALGVSIRQEDEADVFRLNEVEVHAVGGPAVFRSYLVDQLRAFDPDWTIVSAEDPSQNLLDASLKTCPSKVIYMMGSPTFLPFGPQSFYPSERRRELIEQVAAMVVPSEWARKYVMEWSGIDSVAIPPLTHGPGPFPNLGHFDNPFITMVNPSAIKGISIFLEMARALPEYKFAAVPTWGTTPADIQALAKAPNIELLEPSTDFNTILAQTRVLLMPSLWQECFGGTVVEAMLAGVPALASNVGGLPEAKLGTDFLLPVRPIERFTEELDGNNLPIPIVPEQDITPWREALRLLLSDRALYEKQSATVRETALAYAARLGVEPYEALFDKLALPFLVSRSPAAGLDTNSASAGSASAGELGTNGLNPKQQALMMLILREKAAKRSGQDPGAVPGLAPVPRTRHLPLSFAQQRLWFIDQLEPDTSAYNASNNLHLLGDLDISALFRSCDEIIRRHEVLRTRIVAVRGEPMQEIMPPLHLAIPVIDLSDVEAAAREPMAVRLAAEEARRPFDLTRAPLRALILRLAGDDHIVVFTVHHIASDGWSVGILAREFTALYEAYRKGQASPLPELPIQYADYAVWQRKWLQGEELERQIGYWRKQLTGLPPLKLPSDHSRPVAATHRGAQLPVALSIELSEALGGLSRRHNITLFMALLAAWQLVLSRCAGQNDIAVGTDVAGRNRSETEGLIGFFINQLVLRTHIDDSLTFAGLLEQVRETTLAAYASQDLPFERLVEELAPDRDLSRTPLFQVKLVLQNTPQEELRLGGLDMGGFSSGAQTSKLDLHLMLDYSPKHGIRGTLRYATDLFEEARMQRLIRHFEAALESAVADANQPLSSILQLSDDERRSAVAEWTVDEESLLSRLDGLSEEEIDRLLQDTMRS